MGAVLGVVGGVAGGVIGNKQHKNKLMSAIQELK
jgi:hypothetical protein